MAIVLFNLISQWSYFNYAHNSINVDTGGIFEFDILEDRKNQKRLKEESTVVKGRYLIP